MTTHRDLKKRIRARQTKTGESYTTARAWVLRARQAPGDGTEPRPERVSAVVLRGDHVSLRVRILGRADAFTLRCSNDDAWRIAPAQLIEITLAKRWTFGGHAYASGRIERVWTDVPALGLSPLQLEDRGVCDLSEGYAPFEPSEPYAKMWDFFASTPRRAYEFDAVAWDAGGGGDDDAEACLVSDAAEIAYQDRAAARNLLMDALATDLRCIDAHAHLGNLSFDVLPNIALRHYEVGVAIGELSLGPGFNGMLLWGYLYNRPFLRALNGYGLCLWRLGHTDKARRVFERILSLNPPDNQGVRCSWNDIRNGRPWTPDDDAVVVGGHGGDARIH